LQFQPFDDAYLQRLRSGDFRTQEHFVAYFTELIQLKLRSRSFAAHMIEDVRQETFARVFVALKSEGGVRQPERLGAFVNAICNNVLKENYRRFSRDTPLEEESHDSLPDRSLDVLSIVIAKQNEEKVRQILEGMPEKDRRLLIEIFLKERDKVEVCQELGVNRDYLRVLLHRAKKSFRSVYLKSLEAGAGGGAAAG
jgi:RNA polymerase sigma-70 factor (ECF subfamily)